jgi:predicted phosphohydrolase
MTVAVLSDTHNLHRQVWLEKTDLLIHAGDFSGAGKKAEVNDFLKWYGAQPHRHKVLIAGNHDWMAETHPKDFRRLVPRSVTYLENSAAVVGGLRIWGSPITPVFYDWAFNVRRGEAIRAYWELVPPHLDILITHGPPYGIGDRNSRGELQGCEELLTAVQKQKPRYHIFGHLHEQYGTWRAGHTTFINASVLNADYQLVRPPIYFEMEKVW